MASALTLLHLTFVGPDKQPATVEFGPKLTVVYGASDTGKSFIVDAIDYMLGASKLKEIEEAAGYTRILLGLHLAGDRTITLSRAPGANKVGSGAGLGDRFGHAAWRACVVMTVSYSTGVSRPSEACLRRRW
jgi:hypothetical protein